jgi:hypothetical protein
MSKDYAELDPTSPPETNALLAVADLCYARKVLEWNSLGDRCAGLAHVVHMEALCQ